MKDLGSISYAAMAALSVTMYTTMCSQPVVAASSMGGPGFEVAYFSKAMMEQFMAVQNCDVLRFYNIRRTNTDSVGSVMAIPALMASGDLYDEENMRYAYFERITDDKVTVGLFRVSDAEKATDWVVASGDSSYAANIGLDQVRALLAVAGCTAVRVKPETRSDGYHTMRLDPVSIKEGVAAIVGDGSVYAVCGEPCPLYCGTMPAQYVHMRD